MIDTKYKAQVDLILQAIPYVAKEEIFALKGGTAINLFVRNMPRLSVDLDLTYLPIDARETALKNISDGLQRIKIELEKAILKLHVSLASKEGQDVKLNCQLPNAQIKIEVNTTTRGIIFPTTLRRVHETVEEMFGRFAAIPIVSMSELYGGKICAALDRQHPRDLFDIRLLLDNEGFTDEIKLGFIIALISHMRPISEVICPMLIDQKQAFDSQFSGMTNIPFSYEDYERTRIQLIQEINSRLTNMDRLFLLSFKEGIPDWEKLSIKNVQELPAVQWKLQNIEKIKRTNPKKHRDMVQVLKEILLL